MLLYKVHPFPRNLLEVIQAMLRIAAVFQEGAFEYSTLSLVHPVQSCILTMHGLTVPCRGQRARNDNISL